LAGALLVPAVDLHGGDPGGGNVYQKAMARADKAGTLIFFVYSKDTDENFSKQARQYLLARGKRAVTARMVVQYIPISPTDRRYGHYRSKIKGQSYPFWALTKPDGEFLAGGDFDTVGENGDGPWRKTIKEIARKYPPAGERERKKIAKMLTAARADLDATRLGKVKASLGKLKRVWHPKGLVAQVAALRQAYENKLGKMQRQAEILTNQGQLVEAALACQRLIDAFGSREEEGKAAREAQKELFAAHPEVREAYAERLRQQKAEAAAKAAGKDRPPRDESEDHADDQTDDKADEQADDKADKDTDEPSDSETAAADQQRRAAGLVKMARQYHGQDMIEQAKAKLTECVKKYPDTAAAEQARRLLRQW
jgi:hypothetical protein